METNRNAFLSYSYQDEDFAYDVRRALIQLGITVRTYDDLAVGSEIGESIVQSVLSASFVCVIISDEQPPSAVMFEAGIATGSRRPVLVIATPHGTQQLPSHLLSAPIIRYQRDSFELLKGDLSAYLEHVYPIAARLTINWDMLTETEKSQPSRATAPRERTTITELAAHLEKAGALVAQDVRIGHGRIDIAATFPALGDAFNPVIIEVKRFKQAAEEAGLQQLGGYLKEAVAVLGLLVYIGYSQAPRTVVTGETGIIILSADDLMQWNGKQILQQITKLRNQVLHSA